MDAAWVTRITVTDDPRLDDFRALNDQRFRRRYEGDELFIAEGFVAVDRLVESDHQVRAVLLAPSRLDRFPHAAELAVRGAALYVAEPDVIAEVVGFDLHRGVLATADRLPAPSLDALLPTVRRLVVLEGLNDGENVGAIARAAKAFGCDALVLDSTCADPYSRRVVRVSMGEVLSMPIARVPDLPTACRSMHGAGIETWALTPTASAEDIWRCPVPPRLALMVGAEGPGLSSRALRAATRRARIPISPHVDSLNVGHATAVALAIASRP
jgi:tRNA G18 (ribose-2'-O)-methylase SpoU